MICLKCKNESDDMAPVSTGQKMQVCVSCLTEIRDERDAKSDVAKAEQMAERILNTKPHKANPSKLRHAIDITNERKLMREVEDHLGVEFDDEFRGHESCFPTM